jgi:hypothetical protein
LNCCATLCQRIPFRMGLKEHVSEFSLSSSDSLLQYWGAVRTQPRFSPATMNRNIGSECVLGITVSTCSTVHLRSTRIALVYNSKRSYVDCNVASSDNYWEILFSGFIQNK